MGVISLFLKSGFDQNGTGVMSAWHMIPFRIASRQWTGQREVVLARECVSFGCAFEWRWNK